MKKWRKTKWCCLGFRTKYEHARAGREGLSILVNPESYEKGPFVLQYLLFVRTQYDQSLEWREFVAEIEGKALDASTIAQIEITYCPWCGANLKQHYNKVIGRLAQEHEPVNWERTDS